MYPNANSKAYRRLDRFQGVVWRLVARSPLETLWNLQGISGRELARRTWKSILADRVFGHAAELGFYFLFSLFPTLFCAGSIIGLAAQSGNQIYTRILNYLAFVIPTTALGTVLDTFNQTTVAASSGKVTLSSIAAIWSASVGISAIQDSLNEVYKIKESRSYITARFYAIGLTILLTLILSLCLGAMFGGDLLAKLAYLHLSGPFVPVAAAFSARIIGWAIATSLLILSFAVIYYWAPNWKKRRWRWFTPGAALGIVGWLLTSLALRLYLHYFNTYAITYGSLGAVIILLTWFYISGLMLLFGAELNSGIEAAGVELRLATSKAPITEPETDS